MKLLSNNEETHVRTLLLHSSLHFGKDVQQQFHATNQSHICNLKPFINKKIMDAMAPCSDDRTKTKYLHQKEKTLETDCGNEAGQHKPVQC